MSLQAQYVSAPDEVKLIAGAAKTGGNIEQAPDGRAGVIEGLSPIKSGEPYTLRTKGVFKVASASATTFADGAKIMWDDTAKLAVVAGDYTIGRAYKAKTAGQTEVWVVFNHRGAIA